MGNYRFRFSDMMPNAWFYKLSDMSKTPMHYGCHPLKQRVPSKMGNYRFRFSDMMPTAWFYKLKDMSKTRMRYGSHPLKRRVLFKMGNYRFRFSDMMPNAWFYKLNDMSETRKHYGFSDPLKKKTPTSSSTSQKPHNSKPTYFTTEPIIKAGRFYKSHVHIEAWGTRFPDSPRKSLKRRRRRRTTIDMPSPIVCLLCQKENHLTHSRRTLF